MSEVVQRQIVGGVREREVDRLIKEILAFPRSAELDADVERGGLALHVGALAEIDHVVGIDLSFHDPAVAAGDLQAGKFQLVEMQKEAAQVGGFGSPSTSTTKLILPSSSVAVTSTPALPGIVKLI